MIFGLVLPWWAGGYLFALMFLFVLSFMLDDDGRSFNRIVSSAFSVFSIHIFVVGFFNDFILDSIGYLIIPMFLIGVFWEYTRANIETKRAEEELAKELELSAEERDLFLTIAMGFNAIVIVPGYVAGFLLCFRVLGVI